LTDKKEIILTAVIAVLAALRSDPDKQLLIYDAVEMPSMDAIISSSQIQKVIFFCCILIIKGY
jgi:hypothetical protein